MKAHYFDIETYSPNEIPNPETDRIITIQFQKIDLETGEPIGKLQILKEWEDGEKEILKLFHTWFLKTNPWKFIPIGFNLLFEWKFLSYKLKEHKIDNKNLENFIEEFPQIDLKTIAILKNGTFKGASLSSITNKSENGDIIKQLYEQKEYTKIENYIKQEAKEFINLYKKTKEILGKEL